MKDTYSTVIVDLKPNEEEILKNLHKDARWGIGRARKEGLKVYEAADLQAGWTIVYQLYKKVMEDGGCEARALEEIKKESIALFICENKDGMIIAGASLKMEDGRLTLATNFSMKEYYKAQPNNLLYWEIIRWARARKYLQLDLGGYQTDAGANDKHLAGINDFKEKWGKIVEFERDYPWYQAIGRKMIKKSQLLWGINKKMRGRK